MHSLDDGRGVSSFDHGGSIIENRGRGDIVGYPLLAGVCSGIEAIDA
ncbi:MAG: hypothetical protein OXR67_01715 [Chloroflexota bacterium]|nr:hypothetical protein [Chloroflexota bacterium]